MSLGHSAMGNKAVTHTGSEQTLDNGGSSISHVSLDGGTQDALFNAIANFTYDWETWMGLDGRPHWINPAVERITGYTCDECMAMPDYPLPIVHPDDRHLIAKCLAKAGSGESGNDVEFRISSKSGEEIWGAVSWQTIYNDKRECIGYRTSVRDTTERKQAEHALRVAQQEAEQANAAKSQFLAAASHDLRQPIQAANMFVSALAGSKSPEQQQHIISAIRDSLNATEKLLGALLDVSRLDAGVMEPEISDFPVADILEHLEVEFEALALEKNLEMRALPSSLFVRSDPMLLLRILRNFVSNALRYTTDGRILIGIRRQKKHLQIEVWDTGIGISASNLDVIFDDFRQLNNPERDRDRGLGLGLAIAKRKAKLLDHPIKVRSIPGKGSVFSITVPLATRPPSAVNVAEGLSEDLNLSGVKILCIDDDKVQLKSLKVVMDQWGASSIIALSANEAITKIHQSDFVPDIIVADYRLRDNCTGASAIRNVADVVQKDIPAIILTGDTEPSRIAEATASGYVLVHKPVSADTLKRKLHEILEKANRCNE